MNTRSVTFDKFLCKVLFFLPPIYTYMYCISLSGEMSQFCGNQREIPWIQPCGYGLPVIVLLKLNPIQIAWAILDSISYIGKKVLCSRTISKTISFTISEVSLFKSKYFRSGKIGTPTKTLQDLKGVNVSFGSNVSLFDKYSS